MKEYLNNKSNFLSIKLGEITCAINIQNVYRIFEVPQLTKIPNLPSFIMGVMNDDNRTVPVIDLGVYYNMDSKQHTKHKMIVAVSCTIETEEGVQFQDVGLLVDTVNGIVDIDVSKIERPLLPGVNNEESYFSGFVNLEDNTVMLIDLEHLLTTDKIQELGSALKRNHAKETGKNL